MGTMIWMPTLYFVGNVMWEPILNFGTEANLAGFPSGSLQGIDDVIWQWFYGHNVLGYWFTTSGVAITYYVVPVIIRSPLYSHLLSLIGFWSIAFFYGLVGQHHILSTPTPGWLKTLAVLGSSGPVYPGVHLPGQYLADDAREMGQDIRKLTPEVYDRRHDLLLHHLRAGAVPVDPGL